MPTTDMSSQRVVATFSLLLVLLLMPTVLWSQTSVVHESKFAGGVVLREVTVGDESGVEILPRYVEIRACETVVRFPVRSYRIIGAARINRSVFVLASGDYTTFVAEACRDGTVDFVCAIPDLSTPFSFSAHLEGGHLVFVVQGTDLLSGEKRVARCQVNPITVFGGCASFCSVPSARNESDRSGGLNDGRK